LRTPFNPMSDAATNGGDATSTGREGLQQVRLAKLLPKNWAVRVLAYSGRPVFLSTADRRGERVANRRRVERSLGAWRFGPVVDLPLQAAVAFRAATRAVPAKRALPGTLLTTRSALRDPVRFLGAGHVVAAIGRHSSRPKCGDGRPGANHRWRVSGWAFRWARGGRNSLANSKRSGINSAQRA
jgi:hypothetical protein